MQQAVFVDLPVYESTDMQRDICIVKQWKNTDTMCVGIGWGKWGVVRQRKQLDSLKSLVIFAVHTWVWFFCAREQQFFCSFTIANPFQRIVFDTTANPNRRPEFSSFLQKRALQK